MPAIDLANIQGNLFKGYRYRAVSYNFLRVDDAARGRDWIAEVLGHVTTSEPWNEKPESTVNLGISFAGMVALGVPQESLDSFPPEYQGGMASRSVILGDNGDSAPENWDPPFGTTDVHILFALYGQDPDTLERRHNWLDRTLAITGNGVSEVYRQECRILPVGGEHFGYADGIGQPSIANGTSLPLPGQGNPAPGGGWKPLQLGEFVLGYPDEDGDLPPAPTPDALGRNGTFMALRKLEQDVAAFRRYLREQAAGYPGGEELLAAKMVGRWRDGTPLAVCPDQPDLGVLKDPMRSNNFRYGDDPLGLKCPVGCHIRRANPRDDGAGKIPERHRIIRRGLTYGDPLPEGVLEDDGQRRGVLFIALNSSISRQFEFIMREWFNDGNIFALGRDKDPLLGDNDGTGKMTIQGKPPYFLGALPRLVAVRGGEYFFIPGLNALRWIASGFDRGPR